MFERDKKLEEASVQRLKSHGFSDTVTDHLYNHCTDVLVNIIDVTPYITEVVHPTDPCYAYKLNLIILEELTARMKSLLERRQTIEKQKQEN